ncbi:6089_t:CDS:2, partial [Dentiscutata erythropus]
MDSEIVISYNDKKLLITNSPISVIKKDGNDVFHIIIEKRPANVKICFTKNNKFISIISGFFECKRSKSESSFELTKIDPFSETDQSCYMIDKTINVAMYFRKDIIFKLLNQKLLEIYEEEEIEDTDDICEDNNNGIYDTNNSDSNLVTRKMDFEIDSGIVISYEEKKFLIANFPIGVIKKYENDEFQIIIEKQSASVKIYFTKNSESISIIPGSFECKRSNSESNVNELAKINPIVEIDKSYYMIDRTLKKVVMYFKKNPIFILLDQKYLEICEEEIDKNMNLMSMMMIFIAIATFLLLELELMKAEILGIIIIVALNINAILNRGLIKQ